MKRNYIGTIKALSKVIDANDKYNHRHSEKVMRYALRICKKLQLSKDEIYNIKIAGLLHDIGKIGISRSILHKKDKLNEAEWNEIRRHPLIGYTILKKFGMMDEIATIIMHHHRNYNGGGYPYPEMDLKYNDIPIGSRIISVCDAYDAMTTKRPYRESPLAMKKVIRELRRCSGTQFDPAIVNAFIEVISKKTS